MISWQRSIRAILDTNVWIGWVPVCSFIPEIEFNYQPIWQTLVAQSFLSCLLWAFQLRFYCLSFVLNDKCKTFLVSLDTDRRLADLAHVEHLKWKVSLKPKGHSLLYCVGGMPHRVSLCFGEAKGKLAASVSRVVSWDSFIVMHRLIEIARLGGIVCSNHEPVVLVVNLSCVRIMGWILNEAIS